MFQPKPVAANWDPPRPAQTVPPESMQIERRNIPRREALVRRVVNEFNEMPGLSLSLSQASRLLGLAQDACARILVRLIDEGRLRRDFAGRYIKPDSRP
jgi:hypothetical protein